jgi:hypothetical protein
MELNGTHQLLDCVDNESVNMLGQNTNTIKKSAESLLQASCEVGLGVKTEYVAYVSPSKRRTKSQFPEC